MSALASGRPIVSSAVPAHIAERISDVTMSVHEEREQGRQRQKRINETVNKLMDGDVRELWAYRDYAHELVELVHRQRRSGVGTQVIGALVVGWLEGNAQHQATRMVDDESC